MKVLSRECGVLVLLGYVEKFLQLQVMLRNDAMYVSEWAWKGDFFINLETSLWRRSLEDIFYRVPSIFDLCIERFDMNINLFSRYLTKKIGTKGNRGSHSLVFWEKRAVLIE